MILDALFGGFDGRQPAGCAVTLDGEELTDLYPVITEVTVSASRRRATTAEVRFESRRDETGAWTVQDRPGMVPMTPLSIDAVFGSDPVPLFSGLVRELVASYPESPGGADVRLLCQDRTLEMDREHRRRAWGEEDGPLTDLEIVREILSRYPGLSLDPASGTGLGQLTLHQDDTDAAFLAKRAQANGYELYLTGDVLYFGEERPSAQLQKTILLYAGPDTNALSFGVRSDGQRPERVAIDLMPEDGDVVESRVIEPSLPLLGTEPAAEGLGDAVWRLRRVAGTDQAELEARARREANDRALRVTAQGELDGSLYQDVLRPGMPVGVDGAGRRLSGTYYVDEVRHRFSSDGYRQGFTLLRNAFGDDLSEGGALGGAGAALGASLSISVGF